MQGCPNYMKSCPNHTKTAQISLKNSPNYQKAAQISLEIWPNYQKTAQITAKQPKLPHQKNRYWYILMISIYFFAIFPPSEISKLRTDDQYLYWPVLGPGALLHVGWLSWYTDSKYNCRKRNGEWLPTIFECWPLPVGESLKNVSIFSGFSIMKNRKKTESSLGVPLLVILLT